MTAFDRAMTLSMFETRPADWGLLDSDRYAEMLDRIDYLEDSLAALQARDEADSAIPWFEVRS